eukprot:1148061-Pelagomonas_calceolata.AAC.1
MSGCLLQQQRMLQISMKWEEVLMGGRNVCLMRQSKQNCLALGGKINASQGSQGCSGPTRNGGPKALATLG